MGNAEQAGADALRVFGVRATHWWRSVHKTFTARGCWCPFQNKNTCIHSQEKSEKSKKDDNTDFPEDLYATRPGVNARYDNVVLVRVLARASRIERQAHHHEIGPQHPLPHKNSKLKCPAASTSFHLQPHFRCLPGHLQITCKAIL